ncbi:hypothetical protein ACFL6U_08245 [Planctomycetota bacterium]
MQTVIDGSRYCTKTATILYEWPGVSLCRSIRKRDLFLHFHGYEDAERIEPIDYDDAAFLLHAKGDPAAIDLLYKKAD